MIVGIIMLVCAFLDRDHQRFTLTFGLIYSLFVIAYNKLMTYFSNFYKKELSLTTEEWNDQREKEESYKVSHRMFFSSKRLEKFLDAQSRVGWHLTKMTPFRYYFEKGDPKEIHYVIDSHAAVNKRLKSANLSKLEDAKDINMQNNDWQYKSAEDAENKGWKFLCASGNLLIVYTREDAADDSETLCTKCFCLHPWSVFYASCFLIGAAAGFLVNFI